MLKLSFPRSTFIAVGLVAISCAAASPEALKAEPGWFLKGGMITGGFVSGRAQADWPSWMQALVGGRRGVPPGELSYADLRKIPDVFLVQAIQVLEANQVFEPRLLRQATAIGYTARAAEWQDAKTAYQLAYLKAQGLPLEDPQTCSRLLTQLAYRDEFGALREALDEAKLTPLLHDSFLRLLALREGQLKPSEAWVLDRSRPAAERLVVLTSLQDPAAPEELLASFRGTDQLDRAVFHAVTKGWIPIDHPLVDAASVLRKEPEERALWFMVRPEERVSDLLWMQAMDALRQNHRAEAIARAKALLAGYPESFYAGHACYLLADLDPSFQLPVRPALRVPGDITLFNASRVKAHFSSLPDTWSGPQQALAARNRFDLILASADPDKDEEVFLRAAFLAGQQDLVARYQALAQRCSVETAPYLFPIRLAPLVERLIREEDLTGQVDPAFVLAMIKNESIFQPGARSGSEAFGIMQLLRPTFRRMAGRSADILDPETNIRAGLRYYRTVIRTAGLEELPGAVRMLYILAGYHAGERRARRWREASEESLGGRPSPVETMLRIDAIPITSTRLYILRVLGDRELFKALLDRGQ